MPSVRISLCVIVKNEEANIAACLDSAAGLVDEMVVVDTGSSDCTVQLARLHGASVYPFKWNDNFSDARNAAIGHADGDWILSMDADERLDPSSRPAVRHAVENPSADAYFLPVRNYLSNGPNSERSDYGLCRLWRNSPEHRFRGRIHEDIKASIIDAGGSIAALDAVIHHYGYIPKTVAERRKHERNVSLLKRELADHPDDLYMIYHMAQEFFAVRDSRSAIHYLKLAARLTPPDGGFVPDIYSHLADCLCDIGRPVLALKVLDRTNAIHPQINFARGRALLCTDRMEDAVHEFESAIELGTEHMWQGDCGTWGYKAHYAAALAWHSLNEDNSAIEHCEKALDLQPGHADSRALLAKSAMRLGTRCAAKGKYADAIECFAKVVGVDPTHPEAYFDAGDCLYAMERFSEAADVYLNGISHKPDHAPAYLAAGNCYFKMGAYEAAAMAYKQAIALKPGYFEAINNLSLIEEAA